jgi:hypothetical protein
MARDFFFTESRPALRPIQPPVQWVWGPLLKSEKYEGESNENLESAIKIRNTARLSCKLTTMIHMV